MELKPRIRAVDVVDSIDDFFEELIRREKLRKPRFDGEDAGGDYSSVPSVVLLEHLQSAFYRLARRSDHFVDEICAAINAGAEEEDEREQSKTL